MHKHAVLQKKKKKKSLLQRVQNLHGLLNLLMLQGNSLDPQIHQHRRWEASIQTASFPFKSLSAIQYLF